MWCVVPAPISAASSTRLGEVERRVLREQPAYRSGVADHDDVAQPRATRRGRGAGAVRPDRRARSPAADDRRVEADRLERAAAETAGLGARPLEEGDQRSRATDLVAEVEVVAVRVVEVDRLLDEREAETVAIEVERLLRVGADARDVVQARQLHATKSRAALLEQPEEHDRVREEQHRDHDRHAREVALDDVRAALRDRREAHAAEARVAPGVHEDEPDERGARMTWMTAEERAASPAGSCSAASSVIRAWTRRKPGRRSTTCS